MCGVAGFWTTEPIPAAELARSAVAMSACLRHRGPDDTGTWSDPAHGIALGHTRLAIIDISAAGHQPMVGPSGTTHIVFNGEIYNYVELRDRLTADGVRFRSLTDTEVILALYEAHGDECLRFLRGMFAFALWDARARRLLLARDRLGKKPLYYASSRQGLFFASEIKALRAVADDAVFELNPQSLKRYVSHGFVSGPETIYRGVKQLPPGTLLTAEAPNRVTVSSYWTPTIKSGRTGRIADVVEELDAKLVEAVRLRLRADVPVGAFLSGGIDSGIIVAIASGLAGRPCATFTVGFDDDQFDERPLARLVSDQYGTEHYEVLLQPDVSSLLPAIAYAYDQPFADASAIPSYCVARFVSQCGIKVVLNGDGGDEVFGGYRRALAAAWLSRAHRAIGSRPTSAFARVIGAILPQPHAHRSPYAFANRFVRGAAADRHRRLLVWSTDSFNRAERADLGLGPYDEGSDANGVKSYLPDGDDSSPLDDVLALDLRWMLPYDLLVKMDIAAMANGIEGRSPLLDHEIVEWALQLPGHVRLPGISTKPLLRAVARKYLPAAVAAAPKRGFEPPVYRWLTKDLTDLRDDLLFARGGLLATITERASLEKFVRRPPAGDHYRWAQQTWILLMLAAWDQFVVRDGGSVPGGYQIPA